MNKKLLLDTINDLRDNPNACRCRLISLPDEQLSSFLHHFSEQGLTDKDYMSHIDDIRGKDISTYTFQESCTMLTFIWRNDRFSEGALYEYFRKGTLLEVLERMYETLE